MFRKTFPTQNKPKKSLFERYSEVDSIFRIFNKKKVMRGLKLRRQAVRRFEALLLLKLFPRPCNSDGSDLHGQFS